MKNLLIGMLALGSISAFAVEKNQSKLLSCFDTTKDASLLQKLREYHLQDYFVVQVTDLVAGWSGVDDFGYGWHELNSHKWDQWRLELNREDIVSKKIAYQEATLDRELTLFKIVSTSEYTHLGDIYLKATRYGKELLESPEIVAGKNSWRITIGDLLKNTEKSGVKSQLEISLYDDDQFVDDFLGTKSLDTSGLCKQLKAYLKTGKSFSSLNYSRITWDWIERVFDEKDEYQTSITYKIFFVPTEHPWLK